MIHSHVDDLRSEKQHTEVLTLAAHQFVVTFLCFMAVCQRGVGSVASSEDDGGVAA